MIPREIQDHVFAHARHDENALELMRRLCEVGPRPAGGRSIAEARRLLAEELSAMGAADIHEEELPVRLWHPGTPALELLGVRPKSIPCLQCLYTSADDLTLPLVPEESEPARINGAAVLIQGHAIAGGKYVPLPARVEGMRRLGARAVILSSMEAAGLPAVEAIGLQNQRTCPIPCLGISHKAGEDLHEVAQTRQAVVHIHTDGFDEPVTCANLVADFGPDTLPKETVILGGHLDSFDGVPGALDNLTGVVTAWEVARLLSPFQAQFRRRLRVIAYTGEEIGFLGSKAYVSEHSAELDDISFVFNMDVLFPSTARGVAVMWSPEMREYISQALENTAGKVEARNMFCMSSDYLPFMLKGIPAARPADFENSFPRWSHTELDDLDHIDVDWVRLNAEVFAQLLGHMLTDPNPLPVMKLTADEVRQRLQEEDVIPGLQSFGLDV